MEPCCDQCKGQEFDSRYVEAGKAVLVYCTGCGHIVGVMPYYRDMAETIVAFLTRGAKDQAGRPVVHVTQSDRVFG